VRLPAQKTKGHGGKLMLDQPLCFTIKPYIATVSHKKNANKICTGCSRRKSRHRL